MKKIDIIFCVTMILLLIIMGSIVVLSVPNVKEKVVNTLIYEWDNYSLATTIYKEKEIISILNKKNKADENDTLNMDSKEENELVQLGEYERQILERGESDEYYKIINTKVGSNYAHIAVVYDPANVELITSKKYGSKYGQELLINMCARHGSNLCVNGGGMLCSMTDCDGTPSGYIIKDGNVEAIGNPGHVNLVGFTKDNRLTLFRGTFLESSNIGYEDAIEFTPFLIVSGTPNYASSGGGYYTAPRSVIAQRKDGIVLFLVTDGDYTNGPKMHEVIDTLIKYGAYNAANLDGGVSATLVNHGKLVNNCVNIYGTPFRKGRYLINGFAVFEN